MIFGEKNAIFSGTMDIFLNCNQILTIFDQLSYFSYK
jgi:hypothetical protein